MRRLYDGRMTWPPASVIALAFVLAGVGQTRGQALRDLIEEALDQNVAKIEIQDLPIRDALSRLQQETGLRFTLERPVLELMPYGERTKVSIVIQNMSVRQGLTQVLDGLGLQMRPNEDSIRIEPAPVLARLGRRLTLEEVKLLGLLSGGPWSESRFTYQKEFRFDPREQAAQRFHEALEQTRAAHSALRQLETVTEMLGWVWRPDSMCIVFEPRAADIIRRLDHPLDMTYQRTPLDDLLVDLGRRIGMTMFFEPGALKQVDARDRVVDLIQRGVSVRQTLERICGNTGLRYEITDEGVAILAPADSGDEITSGNVQDWVRIELEIRSGVKMDVFLRRDQLPPEFREECQRKLDEILSSPQRSAPQE
jgi:hypothetical protein